MGMPSTDWLYKACLTSWCVLAAHNAVLVWSFMLHHTDGVTDVPSPMQTSRDVLQLAGQSLLLS